MTHYYDEQQDSPLREQRITFTACQRLFTAVSGNGVFSKDSLDNATKLLIESCSLRGDESVLDLGCGWGAVGLVLKTLFPRAAIVMSDVNQRAVSLAKKNVPDTDVRVSDAFTHIPESFDVIMTNPPYAAGRELCYRLIDESYAHLTTGGRFLLVARHQKGGRMLEQRIAEVFGGVATLAKSGGFRVYQGVKA